MLVGCVVPLLILPIALVSPAAAFLCGAALALAIACLVAGISNVGIALLLVGFTTVPFNDVHVPGIPWMEIADPFIMTGAVLLGPRLAGTHVRLPAGFLVGAAGVLTFGALSALVSEDPGGNFGHLLDVIQGVIFLPVFLTWWQPTRREVIAVTSAYMLGSVLNVAASLLEGPGPSGRYDGYSSHPNVLGLCAALSLSFVPFLLALVHQKHHWLVGAAGFVSLYGIWISGSRAALLCAILLAGLYPLFKRSIPSAIVIASLGFVALAVVNAVASSLSSDSALGRLLGEGSAHGSDDARIKGAQAGLDQFLAHPLLGGGWLTVWGAHNAYIQVAAAIGMFGLLCYLAIMMTLLRPLIAVPAPYGLLAAPALACVFLDLALPVLGARYVWLVVGLALSAARLADEAAAESGVSTAPVLESRP